MFVPEPHISMYFNLMDLENGVWMHDENTYPSKDVLQPLSIESMFHFTPYFAKSFRVLKTIVNCDSKIAASHKSIQRW